ncbi:MAG TPA: hypothetical protein V6D06_15215 [Trichocoleus sp.]
MALEHRPSSVFLSLAGPSSAGSPVGSPTGSTSGDAGPNIHTNPFNPDLAGPHASLHSEVPAVTKPLSHGSGTYIAPPMNSAEEKRVFGIFLDRISLEAALAALRQTQFPVHQLSVMVREDHQSDLISAFTHGDSRNYGTATAGNPEGAASAVAVLTRVPLPSGTVAMVLGPDSERLAKAAASEQVVTDADVLQGLSLATEPAQLYNRHLHQGAYLVTARGDQVDLLSAAMTLSQHGLRDWGIYDLQYAQPLTQSA